MDVGFSAFPGFCEGVGTRADEYGVVADRGAGDVVLESVDWEERYVV
jgi:hypothetical protein